MEVSEVLTQTPVKCSSKTNAENEYVYILLSKTQTLPSRVIKMWTKEPYAHTSLALDIELKEMYSFARKRLHNPFDCGFIYEDIDTGVFGRDVETTCCVGRLRVTKKQHENILKILEEFKQKKSVYRYNYLGIFGVMCNRSVDRQYNYFCSQFVAYVLRKAGVPMFAKEPGLCCPRDFRTWDKLEVIYEGKLRNYRNFLKLNYVRDPETGAYQKI
ncbi:MAG: hypothetical protein ACI4EK_05215 [Wujia sp.]